MGAGSRASAGDPRDRGDRNGRRRLSAFHSLRYRDYRLVWLGAVISNTGTWMQHIALSWYVLRVTDSAFWVGVVAFASFFPMWLSPLGGVLADRFDRRRILLATQTTMMLAAFALAILSTVTRPGVGAVVAITLVGGLAFAVDAPTRQAFFPSLVPPSATVNAIALNSAQFSLARVVGPAIAGGMIAGFGVTPVFWINAVSFLAVLAALVTVRERGDRAGSGTQPHGLRAGLAYAWREPTVRMLILSIAALSVFAGPISALLPVFARNVFERGPGGLGLLGAALGAGSVVGAIVLGRVGHVRPRMIAGGIALSGAALLAFAVSGRFEIAVPLLLLFGGAYLFTVSATNSQIQTTVPEDLRARIVGLFLLAFGGFFPVASLIAGTLADAIGVEATTAGGAVACLVWGLALVWRWTSRGPAGVASGDHEDRHVRVP